MQTRQSLILSAAVVMAALILGTFFGPRTEAQKAEPRAEQPAAVGRYQALHVRQDVENVVVVDTATGHCWEVDGVGNWTDLGSPSQPKK